MVRLMLSNFYRLFCSWFALLFLLAVLLFGIWVPTVGGIYTASDLENMQKNMGTWEDVQHATKLYEAEDIDAAMEILYARQFPDSFYRTGQSLCFLPMLLPLIVLNRDFSNHTVRSSLQHTSRTKWILSKLLTCYILLAAFSVVILLVMLRTYASGYAAPAWLCLRNYILEIIMGLGTISATFFVATFAWHPVFSLAGSLIVVYGMTRSASIPFPINYSTYDTIWTASATSGEIFAAIGVSLLYCIVFAILTAVVFNRMSIRK